MGDEVADRKRRKTAPWAHWFNPKRAQALAAGQRGGPTTPADPIAQIAMLEEANAVACTGSERHWLRVLPAADLLALLRASAVLRALAARSNLSAAVWQRDLLPGILRYAEFVQLMPASESHHHAHAGGLLAHTLEMLLAAITWRNGHLLPTGATIEQVDRERDVWTYVVFFAALLHDIGKPMTDLRIQWRTARIIEAVRWAPVAGSLVQLTRDRGGEYRVEFTPKAARDYGAHSRIAVTLLRQIAPESALNLLAQTPAAMDNLVQFLSDHDKTSLIARIVRHADQASTRRALLRGSKARFATATSVPLIELMMGALKTMLKSGTELPLNRSGAAGWVYQGSVWLVAKRVADEVRAWLEHNAPEEGVPGSTKNDRLFDTWQEYGAIECNPQTGQAVWYVTVHGGGSAESGAQNAYTHSLSVLRFPLSRIFDEPAQYPPEMPGSIEVRPARKRRDDGADDEHKNAAIAEDDAAASDLPEADPAQGAAEHRGAIAAGKSSEAAKSALVTVKAPTFRKVKLDPGRETAHQVPQAKKTDAAAKQDPGAAASSTHRTGSSKQRNTTNTAAETIWSDDEWLIDDDDVRQARSKPQKPAAAAANRHSSAPKNSGPQPDEAAPSTDGGPMHLDAIQPVRVARNLPDLPGKLADAAAVEIGDAAGQFMRWLLEGLRSGDIAYNQTRALVHFTSEGMALVSPIIFKEYARQTGPAETASNRGLAIQRELIKADLHRSETLAGKGRSNIMRYEVVGRGDTVKATLSAIVLAEPTLWVADPPPPNPALRLAGAQQLTRG